VKINLIIFITSIKEQRENSIGEIVKKTFESNIRPVKGDIIDDPGFHPGFHNGYEVAKVTMNYALDECWVSLSPLELEREKIELRAYVERLKANGWSVVSKKEMSAL